MLKNQASVARFEWEAAQIEEGTESRDDAERELCMFVHSAPFRSSLVDSEKLAAKPMRKRLAGTPRNVLPRETTHVGQGVDLGRYTGWHVTAAGLGTGVAAVVDHGMFAVAENREDNEHRAIVRALLSHADELVEPGWVIDGQLGRRSADRVMIDGNYQSEAVAEAIRQLRADSGDRYCFARGAPEQARKAFRSGAVYRHPRLVGRTTIEIGDQWYVALNFDRRIPEHTFNADEWKDRAHRGLDPKRDKAAAGAIVLFRPTDRREHDRFTNHVANEQRERVWKPGVGEVSQHVRRGDQHLGDGLAMALMALDLAGWRPEPTDAAIAAADGDPDATQQLVASIDWGALA